MNKNDSILKVFLNKEYTKFSIGYSFYWMSYSFELFLVGAIAWRVSESASMVSLVYALELLPSLILGPALSTLADKYNRISIIRVSLIAKILKIGGVILFLGLGNDIILILCIGSFIDGIITAADEPALHSTIPNLVDDKDIPLAVSINGAVSFASLVIGPALCGAFLVKYGEIYSYTLALIFSVAYFFVWLTIPHSLGIVRKNNGVETQKTSIFQQIQIALQYIWNNGLYVYLLLIVVNAVFVRSFYYTASVQSGYFFQGSVSAQTHITVAIGLGLVIGAILAIPISRTKKMYTWAILALILVSISYLSSTLISSLWLYAMLWVLYGVGFSVSLNLGKAALQAACNDEFRGRVSGFISYIPRGIAAISTPLVGIFITSFGIREVFWITTVLIFLSIIVMLTLQHNNIKQTKLIKNVYE